MATAFDIQGPVDAPVVVLIHGLGLNRAMWQWLVPVLAGSFRVVSYDLLGHGQSGPPPPAPNLSTLGAQMVRLLDDLALPRAALVGFSLGGMLARRVAQDHPARVTGLCLLNTPHARSPQAQAAVLARVAEARQNGPVATVEAALARWFSDAYRASNPAMMDLVRSWVLANDPAIYPDIYAIFAGGVAEVVAPTPPLTCPTLVITGDEDFGNSPAMAHAIAAEISGAEVTILPGLRHMALAEDPERTNAPVLAFLQRVLTIGGKP